MNAVLGGHMRFEQSPALMHGLQHYLFTSCFYPLTPTGARLVTTAANRLQEENQRFALITACADGGLAHACILERYDNK
jgi:hypothetical protein